MLNILRESLRAGVVTTPYPASGPEVSPAARGRPAFDWAAWRDARPAAAICPTGAISWADTAGRRTVRFDLGRCIFCGLCADIDPAIRMTTACECAARRRADLVTAADYRLAADGTQEALAAGPTGPPAPAAGSPEAVGQEIRARAAAAFGRSLHVRQVDAGSCNGCEVEIGALTGPVYDAERFGIHFVASPRHADLLLVTGPVTRNMEQALRKTYEAMPAPRLVVAVGACGCSGGIFGRNYATCGAVDAVLPVDVHIPGCPPNPYALLHGILLAVGRLPRAG